MLPVSVEQLRVRGALTAARGHLSTALHETTLASSGNDSGGTPTKRVVTHTPRCCRFSKNTNDAFIAMEPMCEFHARSCSDDLAPLYSASPASSWANFAVIPAESGLCIADACLQRVLIKSMQVRKKEVQVCGAFLKTGT